MKKVNREANIAPLERGKLIIKQTLYCVGLLACVASQAHAKTDNKLLINQSDWSKGDCYHENMAYSQGAVITAQIGKKSKQLKCTNLNDYELNAKSGWKALGAKTEPQVKSKLTVTSD